MKVCDDFGNQSDLALSRIERLAERFQEVYREPASPRIIRCVLHLASGDVDSLEQYIDTCLKDYRDIILWAEYDSEGNRVFSGNRRFK